MAENKIEEQIPVIKNLFKHTETEKKECEYTPEELETMLDELYMKEETDAAHSQEIAAYRLPIRIEKGKKVISEGLYNEWCEFATKYSKKETPYNYELETILKYLTIINEDIYRLSEIATMFIDETMGLTLPEQTFILTNLDHFAKTSISFANLVKDIRKTRKNKNQSEDVKKAINELLKKGLSPYESQILAEAKIVKIIENGHETAELMSFPNGNKEGIDVEGNWLFIEEITTPTNRHFQIIFKTNKDNQIRYIIDKATNIALITNKDGSYKDKTNMHIEIEPRDDFNKESLIETIDGIVADIAVIDVSHDDAYATVRELIELKKPINEDTSVLKVEEIYDQEIPKLKKTHE